MFRSLQCRDFRRYYLGQLISLNGTWMHQVAQAWLVYRLTGSTSWLGLVAFCNLAPVLFLSLVGGVAADRFDRRRMLIGIQIMAMSQALTLGVLTLTGTIEPWHIAVLAMLLGIVRAFEVPARHAFVPQIVPRELLSNAIGLGSSAFNIARFLGPSLAGALVALWGEGPVFLVNALSFSAILLALIGIRLDNAPVGSERSAVTTHLLEGLRYAARESHIRMALVMLGMVSLTSSAITVLMPVFAGQYHGGGARMMGLMMSAMGVGALLGALRLAARRSAEGLDKVIAWASLSLALCAIGFASVPMLWLALPALVIAGYAHASVAASANAMIQMRTSDALRGRVMSIFSTIFLGLMPVGSLIGGVAAEYVGAPATVASFGGGFLLASAIYLRLAYRPDGWGVKERAADGTSRTTLTLSRADSVRVRSRGGRS
jgi:MFS family permease